MNAIDLMKDEHKYIKRMLKVVRKASFEVLQGKELNYDDFYLIIDFIRNFADAHHHKKEEDILFSKMVEELGPLGEKTVKHGMLVEHDFGRLYMQSLDAALKSLKAGEEEAKLDVIANAISYTHLLTRHIDKEDNVIYSFAARELKEDTMKKVDVECQEFETINNEIRGKYIEILEELEKKYIV